MCSDRSIMPDYFWVSNLMRKYKAENFGRNNEEEEKIIQKIIDQFNLEREEEMIKARKTDSGELVIAICDQVMRRTHETFPAAGDIVLVDSTGGLDRTQMRLFNLMIPTPIGGLPLGCIIATKEDEKTINEGLMLLKSIMPRNAFYKKGPEAGPTLFITDDDKAERNALKAVWNHAILLQCQFHFLQALWRWLWAASHDIRYHLN